MSVRLSCGQLYTDVCPKTCANFRALCTGESGSGLHYKGTPIHRIFAGGYIQGGGMSTFFNSEVFHGSHVTSQTTLTHNLGVHGDVVSLLRY
jgi:cyclophilin family peptidyl-prolyl cis-trans isomerase